LRKLARRYRIPLTVAAGFMLLLVAAAVVSTYQAVRIRAEQKNTLAQKLEADRHRTDAERERDRAVAAEQKALTEARKSEQVAAFMTDMIQGVGPYVALGRDTTILREILEHTSQRVGQDLSTQPEVEAELRSVLGRVYRDLGEYTKAEAMHRRALELYRNLFGNEHIKVADSLHALAQALKSQRKLSECESLHRQALEMRMKLLGRDHPRVAESIDDLGHTLHMQGRSREAEPLLRKALEMRKKLLGTEHPETAWSLYNLAVLLRIDRRFEESEALHREALAARKRIFGNEHPDVAISISGLANLLRDQGKLKEAESLYREGLAIRRKIHGGDHPYVVRAMDNLAYGLLWQGNAAEADKTLDEVVAMNRRLKREPVPRTPDEEHQLFNRDKGTSYCEWAREANRQNKFDVAETAARKSIELLPDSSSAYNQLSMALRCKGRVDEAIVASREAVRLSPSDSWPHYHLGNALFTKGQLDEAIAEYRQTIQLEPNHPYVHQVLARVFARKGLTSEEISRYLEQLRLERGSDVQEAVIREGAPPQATLPGTPAPGAAQASVKLTPEALDRLNRQAYLLRRDGNLQDAKAVRARVVESAKTLYARGDVRLVKYQNDYVTLLLQMQSFEEAEAVAVDALESLPSGETSARLTVLRLLVKLYDEWRKPDQADRYRKLLTSTEAEARPTTVPRR
jgi:tetratricopeptide (TPR) repeat protein